MKSLVILVVMIFLHIVADYNLQGILAQMKQKTWWYRNCKNYSDRTKFDESIYKNDYKAALVAHSFEWTFVVLIPMLYYAHTKYYSLAYTLMYFFMFIYNFVIHYFVDDYKANKRKINLINDQHIHLLQIVISWILYWAIIGW